MDLRLKSDQSLYTITDRGVYLLQGTNNIIPIILIFKNLKLRLGLLL